MQIGEDLIINGHKITLVDCDLCTRLWFEAFDMPLRDSLEAPLGQYEKRTSDLKRKLNDSTIMENKHYCEVSLGGGNSNEGL